MAQTAPCPSVFECQEEEKKKVYALLRQGPPGLNGSVCRHEGTPVKGIQFIFHVVANNAENSICPSQGRKLTLKTLACPGGQRTSKFKIRRSCSSNMNASYAPSLSSESLVTNCEPSKSKLSAFTPPLVCGTSII